MSRSSFRPLPIPRAARFANPNRESLRRCRASFSVTCFGAGSKSPPPDSVIYARTNATTSAGKLYSSVSANPSFRLLQLQPSPELGLVSVLFVLSTVVGAFVSLVFISIPAMAAFRSLGISASRLEKVVARDVHGTLLSLKLSSMEISGVTRIISSIRGVISRDASRSGKSGDNRKPRE
ncbi:unnamed protein product [Rhodiola kirilowii]